MEFFTGGETPMHPDLILYPDDDFFHAVTILTSEIHHHLPDITQEQEQEQEQEQKQKLLPVRRRRRRSSSSNIGHNGAAFRDRHSLKSKLVPIKDASPDRNRATENVSFLPDPAAFDVLRAGLEADCRNVISEASRDFEAEFSIPSGEGYDSSEDVKEPLGQKKKEMAVKKLELLLENISTQLMQKLEQMHKQLIEMLMEKEQARIILEEAWKQQEIEWARRREERAVETSRNLALISFIQNLVEHGFQPHNSSSIPSHLENRSSEFQNHDDLNLKASSRRWSKPEVQALITIRMALEHKLLNVGEERDAWKDVAARLGIVGYNRTPAKCREKWENINKYYKKKVENGERRPKQCPYFDELNMLYRRRRCGGAAP